jgi:hypothetical protein
MDSSVELFLDVDDFCKVFLPFWQRQPVASGLIQRQRSRSLSISEILTILIAFRQSRCRDFKAYFGQQVLKHWFCRMRRAACYGLSTLTKRDTEIWQHSRGQTA